MTSSALGFELSVVPVALYVTVGALLFGALVSGAGLILEQPTRQTATTIRAWQNGAIVRVLRAAPEDFPGLSLTFIETTLDVIELAFNVKVAQTASEGTFVIDANAPRPSLPLVLDVVDDTELIRIYAPKARLTSLGEIPLNGTSAIGYAATIVLENDETLGGQAQVWMTALKTQTP